jgi:hypothetical protein
VRDYSDYERWLTELTLDRVRQMFIEHCASELLFKVLPQNANSKNQVYVAADLSQLGKLPSGHVVPVTSSSTKPTRKPNPIFHSSVRLAWITPNGVLAPAGATKLIAYPQYPEVRLSGFLKGCLEAPSFLFDKGRRGTDPGRVLLLGPRPDGQIIALALPPEASAVRELRESTFDAYGAFSILPLQPDQGGDSFKRLMAELCRIHRLGWIESRRLNNQGIRVPCNATNCGGYTLEAELGIRSNGYALPDFHGWEVKARNVPNSMRPGASRVTLFTPEPTGGFYSAEGADAFVRMWGYPDTRGRADRMNFGGIYRVGGPPHSRTNIHMILDGYNRERGTFRSDGALRLVDGRGVEAASWSFAKLMDHWKAKHARAVYVPCQPASHPHREYRYASEVLVGEGALFELFLRAVHDGVVYYDPGISLKNASTGNPDLHRRSQIRIASQSLSLIYQTTRFASVCNEA